MRLRSEVAEFLGSSAKNLSVPGKLQAFWPEANVLIGSALDPQSGEPDYNAWVTLEKA